MNLKVLRTIYSKTTIIGELFINDVFFCYTLEDVSRDHNRDDDLDDEGETKVYGQTAIPSGHYNLVISFSNRFQKRMPEVINVKGFAGIRIHNGNTAAHTHGCLLVGNYQPSTPDFVGNSKVTFSKLMSKLEIAAKFEKMTIDYIDKPAFNAAD